MTVSVWSLDKDEPSLLVVQSVDREDAADFIEIITRRLLTGRSSWSPVNSFKILVEES